MAKFMISKLKKKPLLSKGIGLISLKFNILNNQTAF